MARRISVRRSTALAVEAALAASANLPVDPNPDAALGEETSPVAVIGDELTETEKLFVEEYTRNLISTQRQVRAWLNAIYDPGTYQLNVGERAAALRAPVGANLSVKNSMSGRIYGLGNSGERWGFTASQLQIPTTASAPPVALDVNAALLAIGLRWKVLDAELLQKIFYQLLRFTTTTVNLATMPIGVSFDRGSLIGQVNGSWYTTAGEPVYDLSRYAVFE